jgi:hypothetical protein
MISAANWAQEHFGQIPLGDRRRTHRVVAYAQAAVERTNESVPRQCANWAATKAVYRLLQCPEITYQQLSEPHWQATREQARHHEVVLMVQDMTTLVYTQHPTTQGLGPVGDGTEQGFLLQSVLAVVPGTRQILGLSAQEPFLREKHVKGDSPEKRRKRGAFVESDVWVHTIQAIGSAPPAVRWVHVGDRDADMWQLFQACRAQDNADFLVRRQYDRSVQEDEQEEKQWLLETVRQWPVRFTRELSISRQHERHARTTHVQVQYGRVRLLPPTRSPGDQPFDMWVIHLREPLAPADGSEPIDWWLLTSVPTLTDADAWERVQWYGCRWIVEDYHMAVKTGCAMEKRLVRTYESLLRLLGILAQVALTLLELRVAARTTPDALARVSLPEETVRVVGLLTHQDPATMTSYHLWRAVASLGGFLGRTGDGEPGWKALWSGWERIQLLLEGIHLAQEL